MNPNIQSHEQPFFIKNGLKAKAKSYIQKHPGIYIGGLTLRLEMDIPSATKRKFHLSIYNS